MRFSLWSRMPMVIYFINRDFSWNLSRYLNPSNVWNFKDNCGDVDLIGTFSIFLLKDKLEE